jgi:hypothetical protein
MGKLYSLFSLAATRQDEAGWVPSQSGRSGEKKIILPSQMYI